MQYTPSGQYATETCCFHLKVIPGCSCHSGLKGKSSESFWTIPFRVLELQCTVSDRLEACIVAITDSSIAKTQLSDVIFLCFCFAHSSNDGLVHLAYV
jgi:hypothetical protein